MIRGVEVGVTYDSNGSGRFIVIKINNSRSVLIRFVDTGYESCVMASSVRGGAVKDKMLPSVCGVGFIGDGRYESKSGGKMTPQYMCWSRMITRCYSDGYHKKRPTYRDAEVCEEWQNFQTFAEWYDENYPYDGESYDLDKDILIDGNKTYHPAACMFVTSEENSRHSARRLMREASLISPEGEAVTFTNQNEFCKVNGLSQSCISDLINSKRDNYKGWKRAENG